MSHGCYNHPPHKDHLTTHNIEVVWVDGQPTMQVVTRSFENKFDRSCRYTHTELGQKDFNCVGCKHKTTVIHCETSTTKE